MPVPAEYLTGPHGAASGRARSCSRRSSAATATRSMAAGASADRRSTLLPLRLTQDQLIRQVIQGGGNMPAYGKNLSPGGNDRAGGVSRDAASAGQPPARDASREFVLSHP